MTYLCKQVLESDFPKLINTEGSKLFPFCRINNFPWDQQLFVKLYYKIRKEQ